MAAQLIASFLSQAAARGFAWGEHDCMLFAADWAKMLTGADPAKGWRGTYRNAWEANRIVEAAGGAQAHMHTMLAPLGWHLIDSRQAGTGDILLAHLPRQESFAAGVCVNGKAALLTRKGLALWPCPIIAAWHHG
jgi:hypothetical protein